jgi:hypothetical protein
VTIADGAQAIPYQVPAVTPAAICDADFVNGAHMEFCSALNQSRTFMGEVANPSVSPTSAKAA